MAVKNFYSKMRLYIEEKEIFKWRAKKNPMKKLLQITPLFKCKNNPSQTRFPCSHSFYPGIQVQEADKKVPVCEEECVEALAVCEKHIDRTVYNACNQVILTMR